MDYIPNIQNQNYKQRKDSPFMATLSLLMGILSLFACFIGLSIFISSLGLIFAFLSRGGEREFSVPAIWGITANLIGFIFGLCLIAILIWGVFHFGGLQNFYDVLTKYSNISPAYLKS